MRAYDFNLLLREFANLPEFEGLVIDYQKKSGEDMHDLLFRVLDEHLAEFTDPYQLMEIIFRLAQKHSLQMPPIITRLQEKHAELLKARRGSNDRWDVLLHMNRKGRAAALATPARKPSVPKKNRSPKPAPKLRSVLTVDDLKGKVNTAIMTVRQDEFEAVLMRFDNRRPVEGGRTGYEYARVPTPYGDKGVVICRCHEQGTSTAQSVARNLVEEIEPPWVLLVGIAGGFPDTDFTLGDLLVANRVQDFSVTAALEGNLASVDVRGGPLHPDVQKLVGHLPATAGRMGPWASVTSIRATRPVERIPRSISHSSFYGSTKWRRSVRDSLIAHFGPDAETGVPKLRMGSNVSSNILLKDATLAEHWKRFASKAVSVEMEMIGVYEAIHSYGAGNRLVGIRGVSDIVGYKRDPKWTSYACHTAASFTRALLELGALDLIKSVEKHQSTTAADA